MIVFRTAFPVKNNLTIEVFFHIVFEWIKKSPHTTLQSRLAEIKIPVQNLFITSDNKFESLEIKTHVSAEKIIGVKYLVRDKSQEWTTRIVYYNIPEDTCISVEINCENDAIEKRIPQVHIPYFMRMCASLGDSDGPLTVSNVPYNLDNCEIDLATKLIRGNTSNKIPIVYVSSTIRNNYVINPSIIAKKLFGIAHVVVEPNYQFACRLGLNVKNINPICGTIGIYWPSSAGPDFMNRNGDHDEFINEIVYKIIRVLSFTRLIDKYSWGYLEQRISERRIDDLKKDKEATISQYVEAFDLENTNLKSQLSDINKENFYLQSEVGRLKQAIAENGSLLKIGNDCDLFKGEIQDFILELINNELQSAQIGTRRNDICKSLSNANVIIGNREKLKLELKEILERWEGNASNIAALKKLGFNISDSGKHIKVLLAGDERYPIVLARTPSDHRSNKNNASDAMKKLF